MNDIAKKEPVAPRRAPLAIAEIRIFQDEKDRQINMATPLDGGPSAFISSGQIMGTLPNGQKQALGQFTFRIPAATIQEAFANCEEAQKTAAEGVIAEMKKPRIAVPGNGPAYKPRRQPGFMPRKF